MRKLLFLTIFMFGALVAGWAQNNAPEAVAKAFSQKFPEATGAKWGENNGPGYEVAFLSNGKSCVASFSEQGEWLQTNRPISFNQLPGKVQKTFNDTRKNAVVKSVIIMETSRGVIQYEVDIQHGENIFKLMYSEDGREIMG